MQPLFHLYRVRVWTFLGVGLALPLILFGCRNHVPPDPTVPPEPQVHAPGGTSAMEDVNLAGTWEYHDGNVVYCLNLNHEGNGQYNWQGGRFITTSVIDGRWQGHWFQPKNDREGRFSLRLTENGNHAEGQWWYTRIEDNESPTQPGGQFALLHVPCSSESETNMVLMPTN